METTAEATGAREITGRVKWYERHLGYGFIIVADGNSPDNGKEIFFHFRGIVYEGGRAERILQAGDLVTFLILPTPRGPEARRVKRFHG